MTPSLQHIAIIMDGNRRWAKNKHIPSAMGHAAGARRVRSVVQACADRGIAFITLFAFSTENWQRPADEVSGLLGLLIHYLEKEVKDMNANGVRLRIIGDTSPFDDRLQKLMRDSQEKTAGNTRITLTSAANYGGRWDMVQAVKNWQTAHPDRLLNQLHPDDLQPHLSMAYAPDPDLIIRTGEEVRLSNFLMWQSAYSELFFTPTLWPDFTPEKLDESIKWFAERDRRFGGSSQKKLA